MKKIHLYILVFSITGCIFMGCNEEGRLDQIDNTAPAPRPITIKKIDNIPGGAIIRYNIPDDRNLLGVKAQYERAPGEIVYSEASLYTDSLVVEGLGETKTYNVKLYSVGRNDKTSDTIQVEVNPLEPPIKTAQKNMDATFGGIKISFTNEARANLALVLMVESEEEDGVWTPLQTFYTKATHGNFYRRGLDSKEQKFALFVRDRWNNKSDTLIQILVPALEEEIPKINFKNMKLPGDTWQPIESTYYLERLWDGSTSSASNIFASKATDPIPQHFTIDLGHTVSLSRFKIHHRSGREYGDKSPRLFELWGSELPPPDGNWDNWYLLGEFEAFKPSGYDEDGEVGTITPDDVAYANKEGIECELIITDKIEDPYRQIRYVRFKTTATYATYGTDVTNAQVYFSEITFWGQIIN